MVQAFAPQYKEVTYMVFNFTLRNQAGSDGS